MVVNEDDYEDYGFIPEGFSYSKDQGLQMTNKENVVITIDPNSFSSNTDMFLDGKLNPDLYTGGSGGITKASEMVGDAFWDADLVLSNGKGIILGEVSPNNSYTTLSDGHIEVRSYSHGFHMYKVENSGPPNKKSLWISPSEIRLNYQETSESPLQFVTVQAGAIHLFGDGATKGYFGTERLVLQEKECWDSESSTFKEEVLPSTPTGITKASQMTGNFWDSNLEISNNKNIVLLGTSMIHLNGGGNINTYITPNNIQLLNYTSNPGRMLTLSPGDIFVSSEYDEETYSSQLGSSTFSINNTSCWDTTNNKFLEQVISKDAVGIKNASEMTGDFWNSDLVLKSGKSIKLSGGGVITLDTGGGQGNITISTANGIKGKTGGYEYGLYWDWNNKFYIKSPTKSYYSADFVGLDYSTKKASATIPSYALPSNTDSLEDLEITEDLNINLFDFNDQNGTAKLKEGVTLETPLPETIHDPKTDRIYSIIKES